jgi:hypothetical protein
MRPYPIIVFESRYSGVYEGGAWFALGGFESITPELIQYFEGDDSDAFDYFDLPKSSPIGVGNTPNQAVQALMSQIDPESDESIDYQSAVQLTAINNMNKPEFSKIHLERTSYYEQSNGFGK